MANLDMILAIGHSHAAAWQAVPPLDTVPLYLNALSFNTGPRVGNPAAIMPLDPTTLTGFMPLCEQLVAPPYPGFGQTLGTGAVWPLVAANPDRRILFASCGVDGTSFADWAKSGTLFNNAMATVQRACDLNGDAVNVLAVPVFLGDVEGRANMSAKDIETAIIQARMDIGEGIVAITKQASAPILIISPIDSFGVGPQGVHPAFITSEVVRGQLQASLDYQGQVIIWGPHYSLTHAQDGLHFTAASEKAIGGYVAKVIQWNERLQPWQIGQRWRPLMPRSFGITNGSKVHITFFIPTPPLVLDSTSVLDPGNYGFEVHDPGGATITNVYNSSPNPGVVLTLSQPPTAGCRISYAWTATLYAAGGPLTGPRGCVRDSDNNWLVPFDKVIL